MRILMLSHGYPPTVSGVSIVAQKVARAMACQGHAVTVVAASTHGDPYREEDQGVIIRRVHSWPNPYWTDGRLPIASLKEFREILNRFQPDIVHSHDIALLGIQLVREDREGEIPKVITCHFYPEYVTRYVGWFDSLKRPIEKTVWEYGVRILNQFDHAVFVSRTHQQDFLKHGVETPTSVISNGVDIERYHPKSGPETDVVARYRLPDGPRILFVGRLAKDKEIDILIRAMAEPWTRHGAHLLIAGKGDEQSRLEEIAREENLEQCIHFLGFVPEQDLPAIYRASDIFSIAAVVEVQSIPTLQALASAIPVVAANAGALPELVHHGENGYLVRPHTPDAVSKAFLDILRSRERMAQFGETSLRIGQSHDEKGTFDSYERLYKQLVNGDLRRDEQSRLASTSV